MKNVVVLMVCMVLLMPMFGCEKQQSVDNKGVVVDTDVAEGQPAEKETVVAGDLELTWFGHASFKLSDGKTVIYIDPWKIETASKDGDLILVSHSHHDHYSVEDIAKVSGPKAQLVTTEDVAEKEGRGTVLEPKQTITVGDVTLLGVEAYNPQKDFHPKENKWLGFVITLDGKKVYYAGDTDVTMEMLLLLKEEIDVALLPCGGKYTMNADEAALAAGGFKPKQVIPYHWGDIVGTDKDAERLKELVGETVTIVQPGEKIKL